MSASGIGGRAVTVSGWLIAGVVLLCAGQRPDPKEMTLEKLTIRDQKGNARIVLGMDVNSSAMVAMTDQKGTPRVTIRTNERLTLATFSNRFGHNRLGLVESDKGVYLIQYHPRSNTPASVWGLSDLPTLLLADPKDALPMSLDELPADEPDR